MTRQSLLRSALALAAAVAFAPGAATAQQYPTRDIHIIVGFPAGGGADVLVRYFAERIRPLTGRNVIVENRVGAGGTIALTHVARSKPDGYTVLMSGVGSVAGSMSLYKNPPVDVPKEIQVVATINQQPYMIVVDKSSPHRTLADLTAAMKAKGAKSSYGVSSPSATVVTEIYKATTGIQTVRVNYRGAPEWVNDLASGQLDFAASDPVIALSMQKKGDWRILGISTGQRLKATGDLPTLTEQGVPVNIVGWWGAMVPQGTPQPVVDQLNKWFVQVVSSDETRQFLAQFGGDPLVLTAADGQAKMLGEMSEWANNVRLAKIEPQS